jgi:hypothetical protein
MTGSIFHLMMEAENLKGTGSSRYDRMQVRQLECVYQE